MEMTARERALQIVRDEGIAVGECIVLDGCRNSRPMFTHDGVRQLVARALADPAPDEQARHLCGNEVCVRDDHIIAGTPQQNQFDRFDLHGQRIKLTHDDIAVILRDPRTSRAVAADMGLSKSTVNNIRKEWTL